MTTTEGIATEHSSISSTLSSPSSHSSSMPQAQSPHAKPQTVAPTRRNYVQNFHPMIETTRGSTILKGILGYSRLLDQLSRPWFELEFPAGMLDTSKHPILFQYDHPASHLSDHDINAKPTFNAHYMIPIKTGHEYGVLSGTNIDVRSVKNKFRATYGRVVHEQIPPQYRTMFKGLDDLVQ
ncbi:MAG TPA: hypothetical protein VK158_02445 [Acidobacteriota bacterium]|nr:hypothetical protein [Acidobacteriota bacterium]